MSKMEDLLDKTAMELSGVYATDEMYAILKARLLPLLKAGEVLRKQFCPIAVTGPWTDWDAALRKAMDGM